MERIILAALIIGIAVTWLYMINLTYKASKYFEKSLDEVRWTRKILCIALTATILEIVIRRIGEIDDEINGNIERIIEKFPEKLVVSENGIWCADYIALMEHFQSVCKTQEIIDSIAHCNDVMRRAMIVQFSQWHINANKKSSEEIARLNFVRMEIRQFADQEFLVKLGDLFLSKMSL